VSQNDALTSLAGLTSLSDLGALVVSENAELVRLDMDRLARVSSSFHVMDNPKLPDCLATSLAAAVFTGTPGGLSISGNARTACEP
jgi:hypothetical protein